MPVAPRGSARGARPLHPTGRLEHGGFSARVVFGAQLIEYENWVDYAARLSKAAYHNCYTAIPLGNAPWSVRKRWANGVLKGARGEARRRDTAKGRGAKVHDKTRKPREARIAHTQGTSALSPAQKKGSRQQPGGARGFKPFPKKAVASIKKKAQRGKKHPPQTLTCPWRLNGF